MVDALLKTGKHTITALTRPDSKNTLPKGVLTTQIDYSNTESLVNALRGQDALVITMSTQAPKDQEMALIKAAGEAGVKFVLPNEWGPDTVHEGYIQDVGIFKVRAQTRKAIQDLHSKTSYITVSTGFWYEWSLGIPDSYGFDIVNRKVTFYDEGETKISTSTWPQVGRAVAAMLSLPIKAEAGQDPQACLDVLRNNQVYVNSFTVSQRDMLDSVLRVTGSKEEKWEITKENTRERVDAAKKAIENGDRKAYVRVMYTRVFYPDGSGDFERNRGTLNAVLGLPREDIDEATKIAIQRAETNPWS